MIPKLVLNSSYDFGERSSQIINIGKMQKFAHYIPAIFQAKLADIKVKPNRTVVHLIALGDEERYGPNRNCDGFTRADNMAKHATFVELGHLFKNHKNDHAKHAHGEVLASAHHDDMDRVELLTAIDNSKCAAEVEDLNNGKDLAFSMGSLQEFDVCSNCKKKAPTAKDHCDCIKKHLGEVTADGTKIYMKNPNPKFFDISIVHKPADRIAYMLRKVAMDVGGHELAEEFDLSHYLHPKFAVMQRLASIKKIIPMLGRRSDSVRADTKSELKKLCEAYGVQQVLHKLAKMECLLSPQDFAEIIVGHPNPKAAAAAIEADTNSYSRLMNDRTNIEAFEPPTAADYIKLSEYAEQDLTTCCSVNESVNRIVRLTIKQATIVVPNTLDEVEKLALQDLWHHYKVAVALQNQDKPVVINTIAQSV